jgi:GntR family transcriptional regulator
MAQTLPTSAEPNATGHPTGPEPASPQQPQQPQLASTPAFSPLYQQIKGLILQSLEAGEWKPGESIPSEMDLAARYRVSQGTVRKAIDELAADNLLIRRQGKGTFVATHAEQHVRYRFLKLMPDQGSIDTEGPAQRHIIDCKRLRANADVARPLGLRTGDAVLQVRRVLSFAANGVFVPTILEDLWLPGVPFKGLTAERLADDRGPMYAMFEAEFGIRMVRAEEKIRAVMPDAEQAALLKLDAQTPLLSVERIAYTYNGVPMELRRGLYSTATHHYRNELS